MEPAKEPAFLDLPPLSRASLRVPREFSRVEAKKAVHWSRRWV